MIKFCILAFELQYLECNRSHSVKGLYTVNMSRNKDKSLARLFH